MTRRLLFVVNNPAFFLSHRLPIALAAREAGYDVHVATPPGDAVPRIVDVGFTWHSLMLSRSGRNPLREAQTLAGLVRLYRQVRPSIVHHVTIKPVLYGSLAARAARVPAVVNAVSGMGHVFTSDGNRARRLRRIAEVIYRLAMKHPHMRVIFQNREHRAAFLRRGWVSEAQCVLIAGSGVDTSLFVPRNHPASDALLVMLPARMLWAKGVGEFVAAARELRAERSGVRFVLVGDPDPGNPESIDERQLAAWAREGVVESWGYHADMAAVLASASIVVLPSHGEGLPKVLQEASACGVPIITTDDPGCLAVVTDGVTGLIVPRRDSGALAAAIRRLLSDSALARRLSDAARRRAVQEFDIRKIVAAHVAVYRSLATETVRK